MCGFLLSIRAFAVFTLEESANRHAAGGICARRLA